jgi:hypothetical protein
MVGMKKKRSFLIEGGVQSPALSNGVYSKRFTPYGLKLIFFCILVRKNRNSHFPDLLKLPSPQGNKF